MTTETEYLRWRPAGCGRLWAWPLLIVGVLAAAPAQAERTIGWETFSAEIGDGTRLSTGFSLYEGRTIEGRVPEFDGRMFNAPQLQLNVGLGERAEAVLGHTVRRSLSSDHEDSATAGGDPWFYTKLQFMSAGDYRPAGAFVWGVLEPAANTPVGADNLAFYAFLAFSQRWTMGLGPIEGAWRADLNVGTGIYESDLRDRQDDVFKFNAALWYLPATRPWRAGVEYNRDEEVTGRWYDFTQGTAGRYSRERLALTGVRETLLGHDAWSAFATVSTGFVEQSEDWGLAGGVTYRFN